MDTEWEYHIELAHRVVRYPTCRTASASAPGHARRPCRPLRRQRTGDAQALVNQAQVRHRYGLMHFIHQSDMGGAPHPATLRTADEQLGVPYAAAAHDEHVHLGSVHDAMVM